MARRRAALATFFGSTATTTVASIQSLVLMPLYLSLIGPKLYGAWLATGELLVLMLAFDMGIPNLMIQRIGAALALGDKKAIGRYFGTGAAALGSFALLLAGGLYVGSFFVPGWVHLSGLEADELRGALMLGILSTCAMLLNYLFQGLARGLQDTALVNAGAFVGVVAGFAVTVALLVQGYGLWSLAAGLAVRSTVCVLGGLAFLLGRVDREILRSIRYDRAVGREFMKLSPPLFASGLAYSAMTNSQVFLSAVLLGPQVAAVFGITKKAAEMAGMILNAVGYAAYGSFSNLYAEGDKGKSRAIYGEVIALYLTIGLALMCAYVAVNPSLVAVWARPELFGGPVLTGLIAVSTLVAGWSYLTLSLYRSMDQHRSVSTAILVECGCRLPLMLILGMLFGLPGFAAGAVATALASGLWAHSRISEVLPSTEPARVFRVWIGRTTIFGIGLTICASGGYPSWAFVLASGFGLAALSALVMLRIDPLLGRFRIGLGERFAGAGP